MLINEFDNVDKLFLTLTIVILITNIIYLSMSKLGRPVVLGGIMAGTIIHYLHLPAKFFDINSCGVLGQIGIVLFMMLFGNQLSYRNLFRKKILISATTLNMLIPFILGFAIAGYLIKYKLNIYFEPNGGVSSILPGGTIDPNLKLMFQVFIGLAVSMTAFPLISIFLSHANLANTKVGRIALLCGFVDEIFFWVILAIVLISTQENEIITWFKPFYIVFYFLAMIFIAPKLISFIVSKIKTQNAMLGFMIIGCFSFAALADAVDLHQVFGGFIFGMILPRDNPLIEEVRRRLSDLVNMLLLPIYFVQTGIVADINISPDMATFYLVIIFTVIALAGKFGGGFVSGKILGLSTTDSAMLGSLLNMRGIVEIVLLNVGLEIGLVDSKMYTILIIMVLICTLIANGISLKFAKTPLPQVNPVD